MPKLTGVAGAFAAVAVEAPLDDALAQKKIDTECQTKYNITIRS